MEARLAELRRLGLGLGFNAETGELMEYILTRDQLRAFDGVPKHPPKPPFKPKFEPTIKSPPIAP